MSLSLSSFKNCSLDGENNCGPSVDLLGQDAGQQPLCSYPRLCAGNRHRCYLLLCSTKSLSLARGYTWVLLWMRTQGDLVGPCSLTRSKQRPFPHPSTHTHPCQFTGFGSRSRGRQVGPCSFLLPWVSQHSSKLLP